MTDSRGGLFGWLRALFDLPPAPAPRPAALTHGATQGDIDVRTDIRKAQNLLAAADAAIPGLLAKAASDATTAAENEVAPDIATLNDALSAFLTKYDIAVPADAPADGALG